jgi:uncharacterized protein YndB with AHSA1/START domain
MKASSTSDPAAKRNLVTIERKSDRELVVTRTFNGPARLVFDAWTKPELFAQWWVPQSMGMTLHSLEMDARTGGSYRLDFGDGMAFFGRYLEVTPHSRIVWTNDEDGQNSSVTTVTFDDRDGTTLLTMTEVYPSKAALDAAGTGAADATHETFGQLDELLAQLNA